MKRARQALALSREDVAGQLAVPLEELASWEEGAAEPPIERVWDLSDLYCRDVDYFLRPHEAVPSALNFRVTRPQRLEQLSLETRQTIATFDELCRSAREIESILELPKPEPLPTYPDFSGEELAAAERERLKIRDGPIADLRRLIEGQGVLCFHLPVAKNEFSGLSWMHPEYGACILINASDNPGRRAFTTAHEYGHLLRRDGDSVCDLTLEAGVERPANRFATCFLMPASDVIETFHRRGLSPPTLGVSEIASLSRRYGVSLEAMRFRLKELDLATERIFELPLDFPPSRYYGRLKPKWRRRLGETFVSSAKEAYSAGRISAGKLAHYLGIDIRQALDVVEEGRAKEHRDGV